MITDSSDQKVVSTQVVRAWETPGTPFAATEMGSKL